MKKKIIIGLVAIIAVLVVIKLMTGNGKELKLNTVTAKQETVEVTVTATGYVQPVDKVEVGTQVSGVIEKIYVDFNSQVRKGQLLAELDKSTLSEKLVQAKATVSSAESDLQFTQQNYDRIKQLYDAKAATQTSYEDAINKLAQARTSVANAKANLQQAQVNLGYAEIYSPINGVILHRAVEQGQTVAASFNTPTLFTIANDLKRMQVEAAVDEADIGQVRLGQDVRFTVDAYPDDTFSGTVHQIRLQPTVTSNVVTYTVIVEAPNPEEKLFPGMTASITVIVKSETGIVVPVSAFKFSPSEEVKEKLNVQMPGLQEKQVKSVWVKADGKTVRHDLETGLNDGVFVIITKGVNVGDTILLSASLEKKDKSNGNAAANPLMPRRPGSNQGQGGNQGNPGGNQRGG
jgi:HlyD family secretion protein